MKMTRLLRLDLLLVLVSTGAGVHTANARLPPWNEPAELRTDFHDQGYGRFDGHGRLVFQELYQDSFPAGWHDTRVYYPHGNQISVKLIRDVSAINVFLSAEIRRPRTIRTFVKEHLTFFLRTNLGDDPTIITRRDVEEGLSSDPRTLDPHLLRPETVRLRAKIRPYVCSPDPLVTGNGWTVDMNVLTDEGAVEHWLVKGSVSPMHIDSFLCESREPHGTFQPYVRTR